MNFYKDRSTPFLSIAQTLLAHKQQKLLKKQQLEEGEKKEENHQQEETEEENKENQQEQLPTFDVKNSSFTTSTLSENKKEESIEREDDDDENEEGVINQNNSSSFKPPERFSDNTNEEKPLILKRFDIKGLHRYPLTEDEERKEKLSLMANDTGMGVGTSDDPFRMKLAQLMRQRDCLLGHHTSNGNLYQGRKMAHDDGDREKLMEDLTTLRESLNVLQQMMNSGVDIYSEQQKENGNALTTTTTSNTKQNANHQLSGDVIQINIAPPSITNLSNKKQTSSSNTTTEEEVRQLSNAKNVAPVPYSKFYGKR